MPTRNSPWRDHLDIGLKAVEREFEADLIISFARTAMRHKARGVEVKLRMAEKRDNTTYSQPSLSATAIMPRAMTGRANEVPRRYTF
jgi:hypothetical protein